MSSSAQILPPLLFLTFGGVGLLWLSQPAEVGAASPLAVGEPPPAAFARPPGEATLPERAAAAGLRWPSESAPARTASAPAPAAALGPGDIAELQRRIEARKEADRRERQRAREAAEDAWFAERGRQLAAQLELEPGAARQLADLYVAERDRQNEVWERVRSIEPRAESRRLLREEMRAVFTWRAAELVRLFGEETAARIQAAETADLTRE